MTQYIIPLLLLGILFLTLEIFIPNFGILGITGIIAIALSSVFTVIAYPVTGFLIVFGVLFFLSGCFYFLIKWVKSRQLSGSFILNEVLEPEKKALDNFEAMIGKEGVTEVPLKPFGSAMFNGVRLDVYSDGAYVPKGRTVKVIDADNDRIIVREMN